MILGKKIVSNFLYSCKKKSKLSKVQLEMKFPQHSLITVDYIYVTITTNYNTLYCHMPVFKNLVICVPCRLHL